MFAEATRGLTVPVVAVLGNHDLHSGNGQEISSILSDGGLHVLDRAAIVLELEGQEVGVVGTKGVRRRFQRIAAAGLWGAAASSRVRRRRRRSRQSVTGCRRLRIVRSA